MVGPGDYPVQPNCGPTSIRDLVREYFGQQIRTRLVEGFATVGTTAVPVGNYANTRRAITFGNGSANQIIIGFSSAVTTTLGIPIPAGTWLSFTWTIDQEDAMSNFWAISSVAAQTLYFSESVISLA